MLDKNNTADTIDTRSKLVKDFGVRALIATMAMLGYIEILGGGEVRNGD